MNPNPREADDHHQTLSFLIVVIKTLHMCLNYIFMQYLY